MKRLIAALLIACGTLAATTITGTFADATGTPRTGSVFISWPRYVTAGGSVVPAGSTSSAIVAGKMSVVLDAVDTATSGGRVGVHYYTVRYSWDTARSYAWRVTTSATPLDVTLVETDVPASGSAVLPMVALAQIGIGGAASGDMLRWNGYTYVPWNPTTTAGDMMYRGASGITRLASPANGVYCVTWASSVPSWTSCGGGGGGGGTWGTITGTLSAQTDLQGALDGKAATSHAHAGTDVTSGTVAVARLPAMVGDSGAGGTAGLAPAPGAGDAAAGKALSAGGTWTVFNPTTTRGDIVYRGASGLSRLPLGTFAQCLLSNGTDPQWTTCPSGFADPLTTRGDLLYRGASGTVRLPLGTNGYCLRSNGVDAEWGTCTAYTDPLTTLGDILYRGASTTSRLAGNTTTTRKWLRQTGTGAASAAPGWDVLTSADLPNPGVGSKGGVESKTCSGTDKLSAIGTDGVPVCAAVTAAAPYTTTISAQTSVSILASTHLQGATAVGFCFDDATPRQVVACTYTRASNGDFVFSFSPAFTGLLQVGGAGGGGGGGDGLGTSVAADIVALFSTCTGTKYLGADGACHDDATGGTYVAGPSGAIVINTVPNPDTVDVDTAIVPLLAQANVWTGLQDFTSAANILIKEGTPANAAATCTKGTILYDTSYIYTCVATNTWLRAAHATW